MTEHISPQDNRYIAERIKQGDIGVIPTDTLYGVVGSALIPPAVEKIYDVKKRQRSKPLIVLIHRTEDLRLFKIRLTKKRRDICFRYWPGPFSIIFPAPPSFFSYLHRGKNKIAFRLPKDPWLHSLLSLTGPLVAPSANPEGDNPARTAKEAEKYFKDKIDFYVDRGARLGPPSTLIEYKKGRLLVIRKNNSAVC